ncbi:MAG: hypothetical protein E7423_02370 [Ruminococcaceae bacterium]|nr:hypothetical protein [Oscillospiraceae bacterium]
MQNKITRRLLPLLAVVLALCALTGCGGEEKINSPVSILGTALNDMDRAQLDEAVQKIVDQNPITEEMTVRFLDKEYVVEPQAIGLTYDAASMAEQAFEAGAKGFWHGIFGKDEDAEEIVPSIVWDEDKLKQAAVDAASALSVDATEFAYELDGDTVTVNKGGKAVKVDPNTILQGLEKSLQDESYDDLELEGEVPFAEIDFDALKEELDRPSSDPYLDLAKDPSGQTIAAGQSGLEMDVEEARRAFDASGDEETFTFKVKLLEPKMSVSEFQSLLFRDTLSTVTSAFNASLVGRTTNVKLACDHCNNVILNPGDEFSYNKTVGPRTYERGFKDATIYVADTTEEGVGGGICQVSSTIYSAAVHADLKITERHNHSYMITYVPLGEDATVAYGSKDFRFVNDTDYPIKLRVTYGKSTMTVSIIGTNLTGKKVEISTKQLSSDPFTVVRRTDTSLAPGTTKVKNNGYTGYVTESYRLVYENGKLISNTFENKSVYKRLDKVILENPKPAEPAVEPVTPAEPAPAAPTTPAEPVTPAPQPTTPADPGVPATPTDLLANP